MKAYTLGELKKAIAECPELTDDTPVYIQVITKVEDGSEEGFVYAMESFGHSGAGGTISLTGYEGGGWMRKTRKTCYEMPPLP